MKELSIEEKAYDGNYKVYTELINRLEDVKNAIKKQNYGIAMDILCKPYPKFQITTSTEFTESDDERIRKGLIQYFSTFTLDTFAGLDPKKILAWLEKQGKKTIWHNEDEEPKRGSLILLIMQSGTPIVAKIIEPNHTFNHGERWAYIDDLLEKQGEKPQGKSALEAIKEKNVDNANRVEPKFKVGDWIVQENIGIYKVVEVCESWYEVIDNHNNHYSVGFDKEYMCHLWTIKDAKDGDVLALSYESQNYILIYKGLHEKNFDTIMSVFCSYYVEKDTYDDETDSFHALNTGEIITPATKEQHDLLFQKMKEAGFEWDAEKKEPKKIEQNPTDEEMVEALRTEYEKGRADAIAEMQKEWSEEDELSLKQAIYVCHQNVYTAVENWLKSLKQRIGG